MNSPSYLFISSSSSFTSTSQITLSSRCSSFHPYQQPIQSPFSIHSSSSSSLKMLGNIQLPFFKPAPPKKPVQLSTGYAFLAHPEKQTGEDAFFVEGNVVGVFDGVGGAAVNGVDPRLYSQNLALLTMNNVQQNGPLGAVKSLIDAARDNTMVGASTACVVGIDASGRMNGINLGDSGVRIIRNGKLLWRTKEQQHFFNCPYQLGSDSADSVQMGQNVNQRVQNGDWVILASDGLFDNMYDKDIVATVTKYQNEDPYTVAETLAAQAIENSKNASITVPFGEMAAKAGVDHSGGKLDDVTVLACKVTDDESVELLSIVSILEEQAEDAANSA
mmetsp:Transcript_5246/g.5378  ORF Transcript_5246/g.5378 Transcript_5246/m.5378 type:complete len:332 (-) Transcript_5246:126-1121(-)|eukprot:CAMPEP_0182444106 /NCGR_PEP_ID=MMETSP1172-20130603/2660_1 /TAXON_ID=708627 /ORGANISM="Timspurckia oligopyrenoides, Strain CCMP3278" /LENGTH=331 /DNA_ID=CAMNT_0024639589 /DNA_START=140 /DNA_END=1135 /DNA_ORIENTATION=+